MLMLPKLSPLKFIHELNIIEDDILREKNLRLFKRQKTVEHHVPAHRCYDSEHIAYPVDSYFLKHF
jgi:hypothetical protein